MEKATEKDMTVIPYFAHEGMMVRLDRANKRLVIALVVAVLLIFASNAGWLYAWMQYDYVGEDMTIESNGDGIANYNYTGGNGGVIYGTDFSPQEDTD